MKVEDIMVSHVATCQAQATLDEVALRMWNSDCGCIPIVNSQRQAEGIVTDRDIAMAAALKHKPLWEIQVEEITAGKPVFDCKQSDDVSVALELMQDQQIRRVLVTDDDGELRGIVSLGDVVDRIGTGRNKLSYKSTDALLKAVSAHHGTLPIAV